LLRAAAGLAVVLAAGTLHSEPDSGVVVFGDSLSDPGNHFIAYGESARQPFQPIPSASYDIGGHHFSNGNTWIEQLVAGTSAAPSAAPALRPSSPGKNYAVGRARARPNAPEFPAYDLSSQVALFLSNYGGRASPNDVYVLWIGGNDVRDALVTIAQGGGSPQSQVDAQQILGAALQSIAGNVAALHASGARRFMVLNVPDPALTPVVRALPPLVQGIATQLSGAFNSGLAQTLAASSQALQGSRFLAVDANAVFGEIVTMPQAAGFADVTQPCLAFGVVENAICSTPGRHLFWDGTHPTSQGHAVLAKAIAGSFEP
jgi:phospholipase/lecithinase/hemolysin